MTNFKDIDIKDFLTQHGAQFKKVQGQYSSNCIFHSEKSSSLFIKNNKFKCFGCGAKGDIVDACQLIYNTDFKGAVAILEGKSQGVANIKPLQSLKKFDTEEAEREEQERKESQQRQLKALKTYKKPFTSEAKEFLKKRGILGVIEKINRGELKANLKVSYDNYQGEKRIIYDFVDRDFIIKKIMNPAENRPKALNLGESQVSIIAPYDSKGYMIVEGIEDCLSMVDIGFNCISLNGTSNINLLLNKLKEAESWSRERAFVLMLDTDKAGVEATDKLERGLKELKLVYKTPLKLKEYMKKKGFKDINDYYQDKQKQLQEVK